MSNQNPDLSVAIILYIVYYISKAHGLHLVDESQYL